MSDINLENVLSILVIIGFLIYLMYSVYQNFIKDNDDGGKRNNSLFSTLFLITVLYYFFSELPDKHKEIKIVLENSINDTLSFKNVKEYKKYILLNDDSKIIKDKIIWIKEN